MKNAGYPRDGHDFFQRVFETKTLREAKDAYRQLVRKYPSSANLIESDVRIGALRVFPGLEGKDIADRVIGRNMI